jgi:hypothetical protein
MILSQPGASRCSVFLLSNRLSFKQTTKVAIPAGFIGQFRAFFAR